MGNCLHDCPEPLSREGSCRSLVDWSTPYARW